MTMPIGGRAGYQGSDWGGHDVPALWHLVESQNTDPHWKLVEGWRKTFELTSMHLSRLRTYRQELAEAWPPREGSASAAYVAQLDALIDHVYQTYEAAVANYDAFSGATGAIASARVEIKKVYDEYLANQQKLETYTSQLAAAQAQSGSGSTRPTKPGQPPVSSSRQEELNSHARGLMFQLSTELIQARAAIRPIPRFRPPGPSRSPGDSDGNLGGAETLALPPPPVIPPIVPASGQSSPSPQYQSPVPAPVQNQPGMTIGGVGGPTLGGATPPGTINPTLPPTVPTVPTPPPSSGIIGPPLPPTVTPPMKPATGGLIGTPVPPGTNAAQRGGMPPMRTAPRAMPPGGVIGPVGQPGAGRPMAPRVNPVGGVIGGPTPTTGAGRPGVAGGTVPGNAGRPQSHGVAPSAQTGRRTEDDEPVSQWDPDNPWETDEGVAPVVQPPAARRVDPGPAIGSDR